MTTKTILSAALVLLFPLAAFAQTGAEHPNIGRGFSADKIYQFGEVDAVNTFNHSLTLTLPLGGTYPVNGNLSYGLTLTYNHQLWKFTTHQEQSGTETEAFPDPVFNAGLGWSLHLGRLFAPADTLYNPTQRWVLLSPDGSRHAFYSTLHEGESVTANLLYTRDNTYLRLNTATRVVEFPDGTKHTFAANTFLTRMEDVFGNFVSVSNSCTSTTPTCRWDISDSHGRHHSVNFAGYGFRVESVDLQAVAGQHALYTFTYTQQTIHRTCTDNWIGNNTPRTPEGVDQLSATLLRSVTGPESLLWKMEETDGSLAYFPGIYFNGGVVDSVECMRAGVIKSLILPTKGQLQWSYYLWESPNFRPNHRQDWLSWVLGVYQRTATDPHGPVTGTWTYVSEVLPQPISPSSNQLHSTVTDPEGNATVTYYNVPTAAVGSPAWTGWEYGLPGVAALGQDGLWKASEIRSATGSVKRRTFVSYTHDQLPSSAGADGSRFYDSNRRLTKERTVFDDDGGKRIETVYSDFDGLGHFRAAARSSTFDPNVLDERLDRTQFNSTRGCYDINLAANTPQAPCAGTFAMITPAENWVLGTYAYRQQRENGIPSRVFTEFDNRGVLLCQRAVPAGLNRTSEDVLVTYETDGVGNVTAESFAGGDDAGLSLATGCPSATWRYRTEHTYQYGTRATSRARKSAAANDFMLFYSLRNVIDLSTGLVTKSYDTGSYPTVFDWDLLGRLKRTGPSTEAGAAERGAETTYTYAFSPEPKVSISTQCPAGLSCTSASFGQSELSFDGFGRLAKERVRMADGSWSRKVTQYNALGWKVFVSEQGPDVNGLPGTRYQLFDAFGRPTRIRPPDHDASPNHELNLSYNGVRLVSRTVDVATTTSSEEPVTTTETYDAHGRLIRVQEPARSDGGVVTTTYEYDVGNRLKRVRQDNGRAGTANRVQQRTFLYDNRGFLLEETHPEKGGPVKYADYDPRGHAWTKEDGIATRKLWFGFDPAERLTEIREDNPGGQLLKKFTYDGSGRGLGKLTTAARYNVAGAPFNTTAVVTESYAYQGVEGRISQKTTRNTVNGIDYELFTQSWTYDRAGAVLTMTYPTCSNGGCGAGPQPSAARVVSFGYTNGFLTDIPGFTGVHTSPSPAVGILYHSNGMLASAMHANGVRDSVTVDATNWLRRPKRLETLDVLSNRNFVAGDYAYDASGNIKAIGADLFKYDKVSRLTEGTVRVPAWVTPAQPARTQGYSFDDFGNITAVTGTNARNTPTSDLTNRLTGTGTSYDEAGNLTSHNGTNYQYDRLNVLKRMTTAAGAAQEDWIYIYTADDERLWSYRIGGGGSLWSLRDLAGQVIRQFEAHTSWSTTRDYVHRDGQLFATVLPTGAVQHDHLDHLGTPRLLTDASKAAVANFTYFPFGEEVAGGTVSAERMRFTGHERDLNNAGGAGDDLDYMHARFCSPVTGRFLSVDPAGARDREPQTWNRYVYSRSNPLNFIDPTGLVGLPFWQWRPKRPEDCPLCHDFEGGTKKERDRAYELQEQVRKDLTPAVKKYFLQFGVDLDRTLRPGNGTTVTLSRRGRKGPVGKYSPSGAPWDNSIRLDLDYGLLDNLSSFGGTLLHETGHWAGDLAVLFGSLEPELDPELVDLIDQLYSDYPALGFRAAFEGRAGYAAEYLQYGRFVTIVDPD